MRRSRSFSEEQLLAAFMRRANVTDDPNDCWNWSGGKNQKGYGHASLRGKTIRAHKLSLMLFDGTPNPPGKIICHTCDNPGCVNPNHLYYGTPKENIQDSIRRGRFKFPAKKLSLNEVRSIRQLLAEDKTTHREIAAMFGVSRPVITSINRRVAYRSFV